MVAILRPRTAWEKLGVSRTTFYDEFVNKARVRLLSLGPRARGVPDDEIETLINELRAERDVPVGRPIGRDDGQIRQSAPDRRARARRTGG